MPLSSADITRLYDNFAEPVLIFLARRTYDPEAAVDILAETFAAAFEDRAQFRGNDERTAKAWLFGIARHLLTEYFRNERVELRALTRLGVERRSLTDDEYDRIEELAASRELRDRVAEMLNGLPNEQRDAVRMRVVDDKSYESIATELAISRDAARARVSRGLRALRHALASVTNDSILDFPRGTDHV